MNKFYPISLLAFILPLFLTSQNLYFPALDNTQEWAATTPDEIGWCSEKVEELIDFVESKDSKSFIVLKDGKIVIEEYFDTYTQDSFWYWASAGKSLMGTLIGLAQEDGFLDIEDKTSDYLGEGWTNCPPEKEALISIRNQISMSTGLNDNAEDFSGNNCFDPECFQYLSDAGTRWAYHNAPYRIVQTVMEEAVGQNKSVYTRQRLGNRIGMKGGWFNFVYYSTARDMARFGLFILAKGNWNGDQVMSDTNYFDQMINTSQDINKSYGYLWWLNGKESFMLPSLQRVFNSQLISEGPADMIAALGKNDQKIYVVPSQNLVVVRQGNSAGPVVAAASSFDNQLWSRISNLACITDTDEILTNKHIALFPNPVKNRLSINSDFEINQVEVFDNQGRLLSFLRPSGDAQFSLSTQNYLPGIYWIRLQTDKGIVTKRFMKL